MLILMSNHTNNLNDMSGKITLEFHSQQQCEESLKSMTYWLKFEQFKVIGKCQKIS